MLLHMPPTLAHRSVLRGVLCLCLAATATAAAGCTGWTATGSPPARDEVDELEPAPAGTYRLVGTEEDSRTGTTERVVETYVVEPAYTSGRAQRQRTSLDDGSGQTRRWETEYRAAGAFRLREEAGQARWDWAPALRTMAAPLQEGTTWTSAATATVPDVAGTRREIALRSRSRVRETATVTVGGTRVFAFVVESTVTTTVADTNRVTEMVTTVVTTTTGRTWFVPSRGVAVRTEARTQVTGEALAGGGYTVVRRLQADRL